MTVAEMWDLIGAGGATATLLVVLVLLLREDLVTGRAYRREIDRSEKLNAQAGETTLLTKRLLDVIETYTEQQRRNGNGGDR